LPSASRTGEEVKGTQYFGGEGALGKTIEGDIRTRSRIHGSMYTWGVRLRAVAVTGFLSSDGEGAAALVAALAEQLGFAPVVRPHVL
jgi:hypothetical protein